LRSLTAKRWSVPVPPAPPVASVRWLPGAVASSRACGIVCNCSTCAALTPSSASVCAASRVEYVLGTIRSPEPLCTAARWNSPLAAGMASSALTLAPPPDCPKMVTLPGSPPKLAMLSRTQPSAATRSSMPALADEA
jgi:hypothetical protein